MHIHFAHTLFKYYTFTCIGAVGLIRLINTINNSVTAVGVGPAASFITLKGEVSTVVIRWGDRIVFDAVPLIGLKFHAIWTATHSTVGGGRETEVAAETVGHHIAAAGDSCEEEDEERVSRSLDIISSLVTAQLSLYPCRHLVF